MDKKTENLNLMIKKLKNLQERAKSLESNQKTGFPGGVTNNEMALRKKLEEIRKKRYEIEKNIVRKKQLQQRQKQQNLVSTKGGVVKKNNISSEENVLFLVERGYSKTSYLETINNINKLFQISFSLKRNPSVKTIINNNLFLKDKVIEIKKNLNIFFEEDEQKKQLEEKQDELISKNEKLLSDIEQQMDRISIENNNKRLKEERDLAESIEAELNLINTLLFKENNIEKNTISKNSSDDDFDNGVTNDLIDNLSDKIEESMNNQLSNNDDMSDELIDEVSSELSDEL